MLPMLEPEQEEAIQRACVKVTCDGRSGTGFFVTPDYVITCAHVVGVRGTSARLESEYIETDAHVVSRTDETYPDIAILQVATAPAMSPTALPLLDDSQPYDYCYTFGFSDLNPSDPATLQIAGRSSGSRPLLKFDRGQIRPGMSGSPVINLRTMSVCAVIQETRDRRSDLGAWGLPVSVILETFPWLQTDRGVPPLVLLPYGYYAKRFLQQYEAYALRKNQLPIVGPMFRADLMNRYITPAFIDEAGVRHGSIDARLTTWSREPSSKYLVLFGEYGSGKTSVCLKFCHQLLNALVSSNGDDLLPLFVSLADTADSQSREQGILKHLNERYRLPTQDLDAYAELAARFKILLILDGFDEIVSTFDSDVVLRRLSGLTPILIPAAKVLLTCRTTAFASERELHSVFPVDSREVQFLDDLLCGESFLTLFLADFDESQIHAYVKKTEAHASEAILAKMAAAYDLLDLARRPLLLSMIVKSFSSSNQAWVADRLTAARLYDTYTREWLRHESPRSELPGSVKLSALCVLAIHLSAKNVSAIRRDELDSLLTTITPVATSTALDYDFANASFLTRTFDGYFGFSHRSFLEFFLASAIWQELDRQRLHAELGRQPLGEGVLKFVVELIQESGRSVVMEQVVLEAFNNPAPDRLGEYSQANLATLLCRLGVSFANRDLSGMKLQEADLRGADLRGADLRECRFDGSNLAGADLSNCDARGAVFRNAFLNRTIFRSADLRGADLWNIRMVGGPSTIWRATFTLDPALIVVGTGLGELVVYSLTHERWAEAHRVHVALTGVLHHSFSHDGQRIVITDRSAAVRVFEWSDILRGVIKPTHAFAGGHDNVRWAEFSPNGEYLATASRDHRVRVWSLRRQLAVHELTEHAGPVMCVVWSPTGSLVASCGYDGDVILTSSGGGVPVALRPGRSTSTHHGVARAVAFNHDGSLLASGGEDGQVKIWSIASPELPMLANSTNVSAPIFCLAWMSADLLVVGTALGDVVFVHMTTGVLHCQRLPAHHDFVRSVDVAFDGTKMVSASWDGSVRLWTGDLNHGFSSTEIIQPLSSALVSSNDSDLFAGAQMDGIVGLSPHFRRHFEINQHGSA